MKLGGNKPINVDYRTLYGVDARTYLDIAVVAPNHADCSTRSLTVVMIDRFASPNLTKRQAGWNFRILCMHTRVLSVI